MNRSRAISVRWTAWLAWLALAASLLATAPGSALAQDSTDDDPLDTLPTIISAEPYGLSPHTSIIVSWEWSVPLQSVPVGDDGEYRHVYFFDAQISPDDAGEPGDWVPYRGQATLRIRSAVVTDQTTGENKLRLEARLEHRGLQPGDTFHYRVQVVSNVAAGDWVTVGPVSTEPLPQPDTPSGFTAVPSPEDPQSKIVLSWDAVTAAEGSSLHYRLDMFDPQKGDWERVDRYTATSYEVGPVTPDLAWAFKLWAVSDYGTLGTSVSEAATATVMPNPPPAPTGVTAVPDQNEPWKALLVTWNAAPPEAGTSVLYGLRYRRTDVEDDEDEDEDEDAQWTEVSPAHWTRLPQYHQGGRPAGSAWEYQVKTIRNGRWYSHQVVSDWSASATVTLSADIGGL